jgi:transposase-like protein
MSNKTGPKGKFSPETLELAVKLVEKGATDKEIIQALGISSTTYYRWMQEKKELWDTIQHAKRLRAQKLEPKLFKRAKGYSCRETTRTRNPGTGEMEVTKIVTKHMAPDVPALKFYLMNHLPETYNDKQHIFVQTAEEKVVPIPPEAQAMFDEVFKKDLGAG